MWALPLLLVCLGGASPPAPGRAELASAVRSALGTGSGGLEIRFDTAHLPRSLPPPRGAGNWQVERVERGAVQAREMLAVVWSDPQGRRLRRDLMALPVERRARVLVARRAMDRGGPPELGDFDTLWRDLGGGRGEPALPADLAGNRLVRRLGPGDVLWRSSLEPLPAVRKGQRVQALSEGDGFRIEVEAEVLEDARAGQEVSLRSPFGGVLRGRVRAGGSVILEPTAATARAPGRRASSLPDAPSVVVRPAGGKPD